MHDDEVGALVGDVAQQLLQARPVGRAGALGASMSSATTLAPSWAAVRVKASRWAGMEKPSAAPPRSACSLVLTRV